MPPLHRHCIHILIPSICEYGTSHCKRTLQWSGFWDGDIVLGSQGCHCYCSVIKLCQFFATPWAIEHQTPLASTISLSLIKFMFTESIMLSNHLIICCLLLLLPSIFSSIRVFSNEPALRLRWQKYWSFNFSISPFNEYSGLISFRTDWFDLLPFQRTFKSLLWHHNLTASILRCSAFFMVQLSNPYVTTENTIALTI